MTGLVVGQRPAGVLVRLRQAARHGPWLVNRVVRWLHRHSAYVAMEDLVELDWDAGVIRVDPARFRQLDSI